MIRRPPEFNDFGFNNMELIRALIREELESIGVSGRTIDASHISGVASDLLKHAMGAHIAATLGMIPYAGSSGIWALLAGNTAATRKFLRQLGTGVVSAFPAWDTLIDADIPTTLANKILTSPTIADHTNAQHDHVDTDGGGRIPIGSVIGVVSLVIIPLHNSVAGVLVAVNPGTAYTNFSVAAGPWDQIMAFDTVAFTHARLIAVAQGNEAGSGKGLRLASAHSVEVTWDSTGAAVRDSGWIGITETGVQSDGLLIEVKGSSATEDITIERAIVLFKRDT